MRLPSASSVLFMISIVFSVLLEFQIFGLNPVPRLLGSSACELCPPTPSCPLLGETLDLTEPHSGPWPQFAQAGSEHARWQPGRGKPSYWSPTQALGLPPRPPSSHLSSLGLKADPSAQRCLGNHSDTANQPTLLPHLWFMVGNSNGRCDSGTSKQPLTHFSQSPCATGSPKTRMMAAKVQKAPLSPRCSPNLRSCCKSPQERCLGCGSWWWAGPRYWGP